MTQTGPAFVFGSFVFLDGWRGEKTNTEFTTLERRSGNKGAALLLPGNRLSPQEDGRVCLGTTIQVLSGVRAQDRCCYPGDVQLAGGKPMHNLRQGRLGGKARP